ncbi:MAG: MMPL family transporter [bacterium]|nr:MMPL family transporter [bacterium]
MHPVLVLVVAGAVAAGLGYLVLSLTRDTSPDAFIPPDHPALALKHAVDADFGLSDPLAIAVIREGPGGVFNPHTLALVRDLTQAIQDLPEIDPADVMSLATESGVYFEEGEPGFERLLRTIPEDAAGLEALREDIFGYELYQGTLVAEDSQAAAIIVRLEDDERAEPLYRKLRDVVGAVSVGDERLVVAGEAAVRTHMGRAVSDDALRMNFICPVFMFVLVAFAYRTFCGALLPLCVIGGASSLALGLMSACGVPVYIVTNGIFVIIMALGVADSLHLLGQFYEEQLAQSGRSKSELIVDACMALWYPVLITTLTDVAGFLALYAAGIMPPIRYFGLFTCAGVLGALVYSYTVIPAGLAVFPMKMSRAFLRRRDGAERSVRLDSLGRAMSCVGGFAFRRRGVVLVFGGLLIAGMAWGAQRLQVNDARILAFKDDHPIVQATQELNRRFDGTSTLNIVVTASEAGAFVRADSLERIAALEGFTETLPHVGGTHSLAGWVKRAHQKMHDDAPEFFAIPEDSFDTRFYLDVLCADGSPMSRSLREVIDPTYTRTNLIVRLRSSEYVHHREVIARLQAYLDTHFADDAFEARLAGRAHLDYHWLQLIRTTHIRSVCFSFACVLLLTGLMFRSAAAGLLCAFTVGVAVLANYAVMGLMGIPLGVGTAMFASIAIGAGVNFPIHILDRLRVELGADVDAPEAAFRRTFGFTGRALFFTAFVVAIGFGLLCVSEFRTLVRFGLLVGLAMTASFVTSMTLLPAVVAAWRPRFLFGRTSGSGGSS